MYMSVSNETCIKNHSRSRLPRTLWLGSLQGVAVKLSIKQLLNYHKIILKTH